MTKGVGIWDFASNDDNSEPDISNSIVVEIHQHLEALAATSNLKTKLLPELKIRFVNVVDLMKLESSFKSSSWP